MPTRSPRRRTALCASGLLLMAYTLAAQTSPSAPAATAAMPAPVFVAPLQSNLSPGGPPVPDAPAAESPHPAAVPLWPNGVPGSEARKDEPENISWRQEPDIVFPIIFNIHNPSITPFLPAKDKATGCAVVIAPGGGHMFHTIDREGYDLAKWLAERGIAAFVLKYRLARDAATPRGNPQPYQVVANAGADAQRAMRLIRSRAAEWGVNPQRVGLIGFSAGGEVASNLALATDNAGNPDAPDPVDRLSAAPNFLGIVYASFPRAMANDTENQLARAFPPTFILCAANDRQNVAETLPQYYLTLRRAGVPVELVIYSDGGHGFGVRADRPLSVAGWPALFQGFLGDQGFLKTP